MTITEFMYSTASKKGDGDTGGCRSRYPRPESNPKLMEAFAALAATLSKFAPEAGETATGAERGCDGHCRRPP